MADEPIDGTQVILRNIQEGIASIKADTQDIRGNLTEVQVAVAALTVGQRETRKQLETLVTRTQRTEGVANDVNMQLINLMLSNQHIRADIGKILANTGDFEGRIRRLEEHLGLTKV